MVELIFDKIPHYNGIGVYSIKSKDGKIYIGSSRNVSRRLYQHAYSLLKGNGQSELQKLLPHGLPLTAEIICELPNSATWYDLNDAESDCIQRAKEEGNCINVAPCRKQRESDREIIDKFKPGSDLHNHCKRLYERRNKPILPIVEKPIRVKRTEKICLMVSEHDREQIQQHAASTGEKISAFILRAIRETMQRDRSPNIMLDGDIPTAILAYEQSKKAGE